MYICIRNKHLKYTTMTRYNKSRIFKAAWSIKRRNTSVSFSECLSIAWQRAKCDVLETHREANRKPVDTSIYSFNASNNVGIESYYANRAYSGD